MKQPAYPHPLYPSKYIVGFARFAEVVLGSPRGPDGWSTCSILDTPLFDTTTNTQTDPPGGWGAARISDRRQNLICMHTTAHLVSFGRWLPLPQDPLLPAGLPIHLKTPLLLRFRFGFCWPLCMRVYKLYLLTYLLNIESIIRLDSPVAGGLNIHVLLILCFLFILRILVGQIISKSSRKIFRVGCWMISLELLWDPSRGVDMATNFCWFYQQNWRVSLDASCG